MKSLGLGNRVWFARVHVGSAPTNVPNNDDGGADAVVGLAFLPPLKGSGMGHLQIQQAWEKFIENGATSNVVRGVVAASWERSQEYHIPIERSETRVAPEAELVHRRLERSELLVAAQPALEQARVLLAEASSMVIITDPSGVIIETAGDPRTIAIARTINLQLGGHWAEADIGTNAIGTAIAALQPVQIHAVEHFCSEVQRWTCAATPIWHPANGELLGIVDISGSAKTFNPQSLAFACAVGRQVESTLAQSIKDDHQRLLRYLVNKRAHWLTEDVVAIDERGMIVYATGPAIRVIERRRKGLISAGRMSSLNKVPILTWPAHLSQLVPGISTELVVDHHRAIGIILILHRPRRRSVPTITPEELQTALAREREMSARERSIDLAKANEALRECLDALVSVPELDELIGEMMAAITRQLGAASSVLRLRDFEHNCLTVELAFQDGRVITPAETMHPEGFLSIPLDERQFGLLKQPAAVLHLLENISLIPDAPRSLLLGLGVKTLLVIPLNLATQLIGCLVFRFDEDREFRPEEIEIARAHENQAALAIQITRLAKAARQSAVLKERTRLAGEIHDGLAQSFTAICMQLGAAKEELSSKEGDPLCRIQRAVELARLGLAEARHFAHQLRTSDELGLTTALQALVERTSLPGRLRCDFRADDLPEEGLPPRVQHELLRIAQEAIHNAVRHASPTLIVVALQWNAPNLVLILKDNGSVISLSQLKKGGGFGLGNMRDRASEIAARFEIQTAADHGTTIIVTVPIPKFIRLPAHVRAEP
jgi:signal transduction histidine kinase